MIALAYEICIDNTNKLSLEYMDRVLRSWQQNGVKTPAEAARAQERWSAQHYAQSKQKAGKRSRTESVFSSNASYDIGDFGKRAIGMQDLPADDE